MKSSIRRTTNQKNDHKCNYNTKQSKWGNLGTYSFAKKKKKWLNVLKFLHKEKHDHNDESSNEFVCIFSFTFHLNFLITHLNLQTVVEHFYNISHDRLRYILLIWQNSTSLISENARTTRYEIRPHTTDEPLIQLAINFQHDLNFSSI